MRKTDKSAGKKRKVITVIAFVIAALLLVPVPLFYKDGGTVSYEAVLYGVTKQHSISDGPINEGKRGYDVGTIVRILWFDVYDDVEFVPDEL